MKTILVIDDNPNDRLVIRRILTTRSSNFEVIEAQNGTSGIQLALEIVPDLIICDIVMPMLDGYTVFSALSAQKNTQAIPFIFLTAKADKSDLRKGMNLGADDYLVKPIEPQDLVEAVHSRLQRFSLVKQRYVAQNQPTEAELNKIINYNTSTNLPNRFFVRQQFQQIIEKWYQKSSNQVIAILELQLEQFEQIIYKFGDDFSDSLLKAIARRLVGLVGQDNAIAHVNDDEFVIILAPVTDQQIVTTIVNAIATELSEVFEIYKLKIFVQSNIGIAFYPIHGENLEELLQNSKNAIAEIKEDHTKKYQIYSGVIASKNQPEIDIENDLHHVLEKNELEVYYQAQIDLNTESVVGAEALLRWHHPQLSSVSPSEFIPVAEKTGLIEPIGAWLLDNVCQHIKNLYSQGFNDLNVSINLSRREFNQIDFNKKLMKALIENNLSANCLTLDLKEDLLADNNPIALGRLNALHSIGVKIALDDFGTGYSSLSDLQSFPLDIIKLDQCLIRDIEQKEKKLAVTEAIINLAHILNFKVVAEGVETQAELDCLKKLNCDVIQGYIFSAPVPFNELINLIRNSS